MKITTINCLNKKDFKIMFAINKNRTEPEIPFCLSFENLRNKSSVRLDFCYKECLVSCEG